MFETLKKDFTTLKDDHTLSATTIVRKVRKSVIDLRNQVNLDINPKQVERLHRTLVESTRIPTKGSGDGVKPRAPEIYDKDPLALIEKNRDHWPDFKALCEDFVAKFDPKFPVSVPDVFVRKGCEDVGFDLERNGKKDQGYKDGGVKKVARVTQKFFYKYDCHARDIVDILRCSFVFDRVEHVYYALYLSIDFFRSKHPSGTPITRVAWMKDRIYRPLKNGYRDVILQIRIPGTEIWAEIQFHIRMALNYKNEVFHKLYEAMRHLPNAAAIEKIIVDDLVLSPQARAQGDPFARLPSSEKEESFSGGCLKSWFKCVDQPKRCTNSDEAAQPSGSPDTEPLILGVTEKMK